MTNTPNVADHAADTDEQSTLDQALAETVDSGLNNEVRDGDDNTMPTASTDWKAWLKAAGVRLVKTGAQTLITLIGTDMVSIISLDWAQMLAVTATTMVLSLLTSIAGLPEVDQGKSPIASA